MRRAFGLGALIILVAAGGFAQDLYFTTTQSDQIWVAPRDGSGTPTVLFDGAVGSSAGPVGMVVVLDTVQKIFYGGGNSWNIYAANVDGSGSPALLWDDECCEHLGVTADPAAGVLYWTTENGNAIRKGNMDGSGVIEDVFTGAPAGVGITLDRAAGVLYWTSVAQDAIVAGNADGSGTPTVLFDFADGVDGPRQIVVDATNGRLYWTQHGGAGATNQSIGQIMVGNADGSGTPVELFTTTAPLLPYGIDVDVDAGNLYWVEFQPQGTANQIMRGSVDGFDATVLYSGNFGSVRGIAAAANLIPVELMGLSVD